MRPKAEIVIVGGGCMGASVAYHLARKGMTDVILVEKEPFLGMGSTGRNAGGVRHQFSTAANVRLSIESISLFERFADEVGFEIDFHQDGYLFLLSASNSVKIFKKNVELQRGLGVEVDFLTADEAARLAPGISIEGVAGATFCARDGIADPNGVTLGFAKAAQALGVRIMRDTEVVSIGLDGDAVTGVETNRGAISTSTLVNAAGPHARRLGEMIGLDVPIEPVRRHIFITEPLAANAPAPASRIMVIDYETTFYFHREGPGILFGMADPDEEPGFDMSVNWEFLEQAAPVAARRLPVLEQMGVARAWAGLYEMTPDAMPIIGSVPGVEGLYIIGGFSGHGFQHSPAAGRVLADLIAGSDPGIDVRPFEFSRFALGSGEKEVNVV